MTAISNKLSAALPELIEAVRDHNQQSPVVGFLEGLHVENDELETLKAECRAKAWHPVIVEDPDGKATAYIRRIQLMEVPGPSVTAATPVEALKRCMENMKAYE